MQTDDFESLYLSAFYFVVASFTSVGYGDIKGYTEMEYQYSLIVEVMGIGFFGYMTGTFQNLILNLKNNDQQAEQQSQIDYWLMSLDKTLRQPMPTCIFSGVRGFYIQKYKNDPMMVNKTLLF